MTGRERVGKLRAYGELFRLPAVFTAPSDVLFGLAIAGSVADFSYSMAAGMCLVLSSLLVYAAGMATNDLFDVGIDAMERPSRPIPSGRIGLAEGWIVAGSMQVAAVGLAFAVGPASLWAVVLTILMTYAYNGVTKTHWTGPLFMGLCRYGNALIGLSILGWASDLMFYLLPLGMVVYIIGVTLCSRCEVSGADPVLLKAGVVVLIFGSLTPLLWLALGDIPYESMGLLSFVLAGWLAVKGGPLTMGGSPSAIQGLVMRGIRGVAVLNGILAAMMGGWVEALIVVGLLVPGYYFGRWFYST